jgi:hypothetical protein
MASVGSTNERGPSARRAKRSCRRGVTAGGEGGLAKMGRGIVTADSLCDVWVLERTVCDLGKVGAEEEVAEGGDEKEGLEEGVDVASVANVAEATRPEGSVAWGGGGVHFGADELVRVERLELGGGLEGRLNRAAELLVLLLSVSVILRGVGTLSTSMAPEWSLRLF